MSLKCLPIKKGWGITPAPIANNRETSNRPTRRRYQYIPIDFIQGEIVGMPTTTLTNNPNLVFTQDVDTSTGEIKTRVSREGDILQPMQKAEYKGLTFEHYLKSDTVYFFGSLHIFWNDGQHNHNDFGQNEFSESLKRLQSELGIAPRNIRLQKLEYGVNICPPMETRDILDHCFQHRGVDKITGQQDEKGHFIEFRHTDYRIKVYDKAKQNFLSHQLMRVEIHVKCWAKYSRLKGLNHLKIKDLNEFILTDKTSLVNDLLNKWSEIIFFDPTNTDYYNAFNSPMYWRKLKRQANTSKRKRKRDKLRQMNKEHGKDIQGQVAREIAHKIGSLQRDEFPIKVKGEFVSSKDSTTLQQPSLTIT